MASFRLTSPAFEDGGSIPARYGYRQENVNPPLAIAGVPAGAESLAVIVDDPDAVKPAGKVWDHWVVWNVPPEVEELPEGWDASGASEGTNDFGERGYGGPNPPDREHSYRFQVIALDATLDLPGETDADGLREAMDGHVIEGAELTGTYAP
jgi:hypothetical protein